MPDAQVVVIGAGVVGLAIAAELSRDHAPLFVLERNAEIGQETSSRNSEVIHAGLYYGRDMLKTRLCIEGNPLIYELCARHSIPHRRTGKIITASAPDELPALEKLHRHGTDLGVKLDLLTARQVLDLEPRIATHGGIFSPTSGIVSAHGLMDALQREALAHGAVVQRNCEVTGLRRDAGGMTVEFQEAGQRSSLTAEWVVNAAGLDSDSIAALAGIDVDAAGYRLRYCKGSYFALSSALGAPVSRLVYPMPGRHSLGVHALVDLGGRIKFGPDVEYLPDRRRDYRVDDAKRHAFAESVRRILPFVKDEDLTPDMSGIRPKLQPPGEPMRDFIIRREADRGLPGLIDLVGIESPGLTAAPAIARYVRRLMD